MREITVIIALTAALALAGCVTTTTKTKSQPESHNEHVQSQARYASLINWNSMNEGMKIAKESKRPIIVDFAVAEGCPRCDFLQKHVYSKPELADKINRDFVPIFVDLSKDLTPEEKALGEKFKYRNDCLLLFLDYEGNVIKDPKGKKMCYTRELTPGIYMEKLNYVLEHYVKE